MEEEIITEDQSKEENYDPLFEDETNFTEAELSGTEEETLQLYRWGEGQWLSKGITCWDEPVDGQVSCSVAPQALGEFALMEAQHKAYLPLVLGGYKPYY